ncbi:MAG: Dam family site-specific DNA-(adenine-N6)-methyltransferase [Muribaculaceae bacterium]|nr:Dam family site-specific DNA-(adenine-N6)-methyltransferase [Muribaculaceae bacterium]
MISKQNKTVVASIQQIQTKNICSPMNYIGGKYKLLPQILPLFPKDINTFVDLFCGGCNVGINVNATRIVFNDNLTYLIDLYRLFYTLPQEDILAHIYDRISEFSLSLTNDIGYKQLRTYYNEHRNALDLFVLVAYSFNHQIRFNNSHEFNNPFGKERSSYNKRMEENLVAFIQRLQENDINFSSKNFNEFDFSELNSNDFVYCDPPYLITNGSYNDGKRGFTGWGKNEEILLLSILDNLTEQGVKFALSNVLEHKGASNNILIDWANDNNYNIHHLCKDYSNSSYQLKNRNKSITDEVLITNYA